MSPFELGMLVCFGISWPISVLKTLRMKSTKGKSILFMTVILLGYVAGIIHKIWYSLDLVIFVYIFNFLMVAADVSLYWYYFRLERIAQKKTQEVQAD